MYTYTHILLLFFSTIVYPRILTAVPCAMKHFRLLLTTWLSPWLLETRGYNFCFCDHLHILLIIGNQSFSYIYLILKVTKEPFWSVYSLMFGFSKISRHFIFPYIQHSFPIIACAVFYFHHFSYDDSVHSNFNIIFLHLPGKSFLIVWDHRACWSCYARFLLCVAAPSLGSNSCNTLLQRWIFIVKSQRPSFHYPCSNSGYKAGQGIHT